MPENIAFAFILTLIAGLSTGIGSAIAFFANHTSKKFLSFALGFSAGVMIYISFVELLNGSQNILVHALGKINGQLIATASFFGGIFLAALIDKLVPADENPHEARLLEEMNFQQGRQHGGCSHLRAHHKRKKLMRMGLITALSIGIHNFPEGIATFMAGMSDTTVGISIAVAIAIHNIPEGIAVSVPVYYATGSRKKAFYYSFLSGLSEPVGAIVAYLILLPFISDILLSCVFAAVAGIMVFISLDELLPAAHEYGEHHISVYGLIAGMGLMAVSIISLS